MLVYETGWLRDAVKGKLEEEDGVEMLALFMFRVYLPAPGAGVCRGWSWAARQVASPRTRPATRHTRPRPLQ